MSRAGRLDPWRNLAVVATALAAGCDSGSERSDAPVEPDRVPYVEAAATAFGFGDGELADCIGAALVSEAFYDRIEQAGLTLEQFVDDIDRRREVAALSAGDVRSITDAVDACGDVVDGAIAGNAAPDQRAADCLVEHHDDRDLAEYRVVGFLGGEPSTELIAATAELDACESSS